MNNENYDNAIIAAPRPTEADSTYRMYAQPAAYGVPRVLAFETPNNWRFWCSWCAEWHRFPKPVPLDSQIPCPCTELSSPYIRTGGIVLVDHTILESRP